MTIDLEALYIDLHRHPELSFQETRTAGIVTQKLTELGLAFEEGLGKTGVATRSKWRRARRLAARRHGRLPVEERTGLAYASTARGVDPSGQTFPSCTRAATTCTSPRCSARSSGS